MSVDLEADEEGLFQHGGVVPSSAPARSSRCAVRSFLCASSRSVTRSSANTDAPLRQGQRGVEGEEPSARRQTFSGWRGPCECASVAERSAPSGEVDPFARRHARRRPRAQRPAALAGADLAVDVALLEDPPPPRARSVDGSRRTVEHGLHRVDVLDATVAATARGHVEAVAGGGALGPQAGEQRASQAALKCKQRWNTTAFRIRPPRAAPRPARLLRRSTGCAP